MTQIDLTGWCRPGAKREGAVAAVGAGIAAAGTVASGVMKDSANRKARKTIQKGLDSYEMIDLDELQSNAVQTARENAKNALALEAELTPDVAKTRNLLSSQVANELALGGKLDTDTINSVTGNAQYTTASSGMYGGAGPVTAAMLGLTSMDVANQRKQNAAALLAANPLQQVGLSPETLANISVADQTNLNQAKLNAAGVQSNLQLAAGKNWGDTTSGATGIIGGSMMGAGGGKGGILKGVTGMLGNT